MWPQINSIIAHIIDEKYLPLVGCYDDAKFKSQ